MDVYRRARVFVDEYDSTGGHPIKCALIGVTKIVTKSDGEPRGDVTNTVTKLRGTEGNEISNFGEARARQGRMGARLLWAHNPKVEASNPSPATKLDTSTLVRLVRLN